MLDGKHYICSDNVGILVGVTHIPDHYKIPGDDYEMARGAAIGLKLHFCDVEEDPVICMTDEEAASLIKAIKNVRKIYRKQVRSKK